MPFERPTLTELVDRVEQDLVSRLELDGAAILRRAMARVLARVVAGAVHLVYGLLVWLARQFFPDLAAEENLLRQARLYGYAPIPASYASGTINVFGVPGSVVLAGARLQSASAVEFVTTADGTVGVGVTEIPVEAVLAGSSGNLDEAVELLFESPVAGVSASAEVGSGGIGGGSPAENIEAFRARFLAFLRTAPQGGASADYITWARQVAGVTRAWVYPREQGIGTLVVRFVRDDDVTPIPNPAAVAVVQAHVDLLRPMTATVIVVAPVEQEWDFDLSITPDTPTNRTNVEAEIDDLFLREGEPGASLPLSRVRGAIGNTPGITDYVLNYPDEDLYHSTGAFPKRGTMNY